MKKLLSVLIISMFVFCLAAPSFADPIEKLKDGAMTIVKAPLQIPTAIGEEYEATDVKPIGAFAGVLKGGALCLRDLMTGAFNVLTFPIDFPE